MRNLGIISALWFAALLPTNGFALGLGEIEVKSFLNQPLNAEIEVLSARPGEIDDLLVSLASREAFTRAGLSRPRSLSDLKFAVIKNESGDEAIIRVTTRAGVKEPFLNFLIEADWSKGRLLREYTILLDPPFYYADQPAPAQPAPATEPEAKSSDASVGDIVEQVGAATTDDSVTEPIANSEPPVTVDESVTEPIALDESPPEPGPAVEETMADDTQNIILDGDVLVVKGDTLWSIASRYKSDDHSMAQIMLAFQRSSPEAFKDGNINLMKEGAILRIPDRAEIEAWGQQEAYAEVLVQNGLWEEYVERVTGVSPMISVEEESVVAETAVDFEPESEEASGELSLLIPESNGRGTGTGDSVDIEALRTKLAIAEEELDAARIENSELESRISELQARLSKVEELQKMVEIEDDSLAQIQEQEAQPEEIAEEPVVVEPDTSELVSEETLQSEADALIQELLAEEAAAQAEEQAALVEQPLDDDGFIDETIVEDSTTDDSLVEEDTFGEDSLTEDSLVDDGSSQQEVAPPTPVIVTEPVAQEPSLFDGIPVLDNLGGLLPSMPDMDGLVGLTSNPLILVAVGGVLLLLILLMILKRRRAADADDSGGAASMTVGDDIFAANDDEELTPIHLAEDEPDETDFNKVPTGESMYSNEVASPGAELPPEEEGFAATSVFQAAETSEPGGAAPAAATEEQDDVLNEVDVYLAYGLYDNAEELLSSSLETSPERADYRSKLLDTYFATKKTDAFIAEAKNLKSLGDSAGPYWDRVQVMGYELAPGNALFSDAKDSGMSAADLEIAKPQEADFDLGAADGDDTNFSTTDFNLGEEGAGDDLTDMQQAFGEAGDIAETQQIPQLDDLNEEDDTDIRVDVDGEPESTGLELPDEIGDELEFSMNDATDEFELPDELDLDSVGELADAAVDDLDIDDIAMEFEADADDGFDLGMEDTALADQPGPGTDDLVIDEDDDDDISIIDFGGDDFVEPTDLVESIADIDDDTVMMAVDVEENSEVKTGTFAPGDFDEPTQAVDSIDDIDDLMLPDDVDEVSTKLDLARAFIDMGDTEGARGSLEEVMQEGNDEQKSEAKALLDQL